MPREGEETIGRANSTVEVHCGIFRIDVLSRETKMTRAHLRQRPSRRGDHALNNNAKQ